MKEIREISIISEPWQPLCVKSISKICSMKTKYVQNICSYIKIHNFRDNIFAEHALDSYNTML